MQQSATMTLEAIASCYYIATQRNATTTLQSNDAPLQQTTKEFMQGA
jgi:hypothetical protein